MFDPIFKENVQGQKHPGRYVVTELPSYIEPKVNTLILIWIHDALLIESRRNALLNNNHIHTYR